MDIRKNRRILWEKKGTVLDCIEVCVYATIQGLEQRKADNNSNSNINSDELGTKR